MSKHKILLVDDEADIRFVLGRFLRSQGYDVVEADSCQTAEAAFRSARPHAAILDYQLPDGTALDLLPRLKEVDPAVPLLILTAHGTIPMAVHAIKEGAEQFLTKPVELPALAILLRRVLDDHRNRRTQTAGASRQTREAVDPFLGTCAAIRALAAQSRRVLDTDSPVLIRGETGTGKTVLARWLHEHSARAQEAFVDLNCAALSRELLETELFGVAGDRPGIFEAAAGGGVLLDQVGDLPLELQPRLLAVLEHREVRRLGSDGPIAVDARVMATTSRNLAAGINGHRFRSDLHARLSAIQIALPPLRTRLDDLPLLVADLAPRLGLGTDDGAHLASQPLLAELGAHHWPGNLCELRSYLEACVALRAPGVIHPPVHPPGPPPGAVDTTQPFHAARSAWVEAFDRSYAIELLHRCDGNVATAARAAGLDLLAFYHLLWRVGIRGER